MSVTMLQFVLVLVRFRQAQITVLMVVQRRLMELQPVIATENRLVQAILPHRQVRISVPTVDPRRQMARVLALVNLLLTAT